MYTLRKQTRKVSLRALLGLVLIVGATAVIANFTGLKQMFVQAASEDSVSVEPLWPADNATVNGTINLRYTVRGLSPDKYESFWSVDNGVWNRMSADPNNAAVSVGSVNVNAWTWKKDGTYPITFTALVKGSWQPVQKTVTVHIGPAEGAPAATSAVQAVAKAVAPATAVAASAVAPQGGETLYANPASDVAKQALAWASTHQGDAAKLQRLASQPVSEWFGGWNSNVQAEANAYVSAAAAASKVPQLVAYNVPQRDCGGFSAGGAADGQSYLNWVRSMAAGINGRRAIVILEPDAVANTDCLNAGDQQNRLSLLNQAVSILKSGARTTVYLDAGHPGWIPADTMATRLKAANIAQADGFSLNVSNFISTGDNVSYGNQISKLVGGKHFVIDTSRNGNGATNDKQWCNPAGRAVGQTPTLQTGNALVDGYLWVKGPGASDGSCGATADGTSAPVAGAWWPQYALQLLRNASW